ncbi:Monoamine oxidase [Pseudomonas reinekei]|uniref:FAD-dependent oxidoreductase n=2 Tax=Pseudomonas reinekei TaxID=395598 RepID=A0A1H0IRK8_PSERE|nr:FAD-dependent oxidoreductase [Pseudomonas reinekei]SDO34094.1 Monoamine oxidase [Pseudomonas reinekei]
MVLIMSTYDPTRNRRNFLKAAGLSIAGSVIASNAIAAGLARSEESKKKTIANGSEYDVIVIGGGFAGLAAARDCALRGQKVLLLEARNRVGGRTFTSNFMGHQIELGGTWVHQAQPFVWSEIRRYGLGIVESPGVGATQGSWLYNDKLYQGDMVPLFTKMNQAFAEFCNIDGQGGRTIFPRPYEPFLNREKVNELDKLSLLDRLNQVKLDDEAKALVNVMVAQNCNNAPETGSFLDQLHWYANCDYDLGMLFDRCGRFKIAEGMTGLAHAILGDSDADVLMSTPVTRVQQNAQGAVVTTGDSKQFKAKAVICAVPMNCLGDIAFEPALSSKKLEAAKVRHTGNGIKVYAHIKQDIGAWLGMAPYPNPIILAATEENSEHGTTLVLFVRPDGLDGNNAQQVQAELRKFYPGVDVVKSVSYGWAEDPYSKGTWAFYRPGMMSKSQEALMETEGVVHFASGDSATGWHGFVDGALQGGVETARIVCKLLVAQTRA